jgi:hypothetical protein
MSTEYSSVLVVGWLIDKDDLPKKFIKTKPKITHKEDRFDSKTGQKATPEVVVDEKEREVLVLDGIEYEEEYDEYDFFCALASKVGAVAGQTGDFNNGDMKYTLEPKPLAKTLTGDQSLYSMPKYAKNAKTIHKRLTKLGFKLPGPQVMAVLQVS